jgi:signal peptidase I
MDWKPNRWLAAFASLFFWPIGLLYLGRWRLPVVYFGAFLAAAMIELIAGTPMYSPFVIMLASPFHAFWIAKKAEPSPRPWYSRWYGIVAVYAGLFAIIVPLRAFLVEPFRLPTTAMEPTIPLGSYLIVSKLGYRHFGTYGFEISRGTPVRTPKRGTLVVFEAPTAPSKRFIKRVLGLPGDTIVFNGHVVSINGQTLRKAEHGGTVTEEVDGVTYHTLVKEKDPAPDQEVVVPAGHYFLVGDNRGASDDSRRFGPVAAELLIGEVIYVIPRGRA